MIVTPAEPSDLVAMVAERRAHGSPLPRRVYKCLLAQVVASEAYTVREAAESSPLFIVGCLDLAPGSAGEIFFLAPRGGLGRYMVRAHRIALRLFRQAAATRPAGYVCFVRAENRNGQRLARSLGFHPTGEAIEDFEAWRRAS